MNLITIDTGNRTGVAHFRERVLVRAATYAHEEVFQQPWILAMSRSEPLHIQIERPTYYPHGRNETDVDDLLGLAIKVGELRRFFIMEHATEPALVRPHEWKGQLPKEVCKERAQHRLSTAELAQLPKRMSNHAWDAIGIGLWCLGRFGS